MAKPLNLYQGPAPAAMGMMGQGILEAGANIGRTLQGGYESMGKGLASGISGATSSIAGAYNQSKDDQAKFDATKKLFGAFESYLPKQKDPQTGKEFSPVADQIRSIFNDTTMSVREKNQMAPILLSFLGNAQQQYGRESVANIMNAGRVEAAEARRPAPITGGVVGQVSTVDQILDAPVGQAPAAPATPEPAAPYMIQRPPAQPQPAQRGPLSNMPRLRIDPVTQKSQFWSPGAKRYIDESESELIFGPDFKIVP
jgi:hypothetical protein